MDKQKILTKYQKPEDKLLISKMLDKIEASKSKARIETTDFLDPRQVHMLEIILISEQINNYIFTGGVENAQRKLLAFFPDKFKNLIDDKNILPIDVLRIKLPKEMKGKYTHRDYLGGLIKLGIKREKIGDILVFEAGADILLLTAIFKFVETNISVLNESIKKFISKIVKELRIESLCIDVLRDKETDILDIFG